MECDRYARIVESDVLREEVANWADALFRGHAAVQSDFTLGRLIGPGRNGAFSRKGIAAALPKGLDSVEVRPLGKDRVVPDGLFLGHANFRGLVIARISIEHLVENTEISNDAFVRVAARVGYICYNER